MKSFWFLGAQIAAVALATATVSGNAIAQAPPLILQQWGISKDGSFRSLVEARSAKKLHSSGSETGRGAIRFIDTVSPVAMELGFYEYGGGMFVDDLFEFFAQGVSVRNFKGNLPSFVDVRDSKDSKDIRLYHDGTRGYIATTGFSPGGIRIGGPGGPLQISSTYGLMLEMDDSGSANFPAERMVTKGAVPQSAVCGTAAVVRGTNTAMSVTVGAGAATSLCRVNFTAAFPARPACIAHSDTDIVPLSSSETTTSVTVTSLSPLTPGSKLKIHCIGI